MRLACLAMIAAACGGGGAGEAPPAPPVRAITAIAPAAGTDDVIVARVAGRPVWGSCVAHQVARGATDRKTALHECIAFELMAQEAERRGMVAAASADDAVRTALVSRLVELGFEATHTTPESLGDVMTKWLDANAWRMHRPELRSSSYARLAVAKTAGPEQDAAAKAVAEKIADALSHETGLFGVNLHETANRLAAGTGVKLEVADVPATQRVKLEATYADALFALPDVGRASAAVRTPWGWDVIVWTGGLPALDQTREQLAASAFPELRRVAFGVWVNALIKELGVQVTIDQAQVAKLEGASS
jgi:hypothetical protein